MKSTYIDTDDARYQVVVDDMEAENVWVRRVSPGPQEVVARGDWNGQFFSSDIGDEDEPWVGWWMDVEMTCSELTTQEDDR